MAEVLDERKLERKIRRVYRDVAEIPEEEYHFEMGRELAERLGYPTSDLDRVPGAAADSFAGVGYHTDLAALRYGDDVVDLGSGSGTDVFVAALHVGDEGSVTGLDMTDEQLGKSRRLRDEAEMTNVTFERGRIEELPFDDECFDVVISNGVINLSPAKERVFAEANRVLRPGGRLAISDIVTAERMPERIKTNADLWASCIGGAEQIDDYTAMVEDAGFEVTDVRENDQYAFISEQAQNACRSYGVRSVSLAAEKR